MRKTAAVIFTLLVAVAPAMADDDCRASIDQATALFDRYHEDAANFDRAVTRYEEAANSDACAYEARWRLSELYLCWGTVARDKKEKIAKFEAGVRYAEQAIEKNAGGKEAHYELAANLGSIVQIKGPMKHLMKVRRLRKENQKALAIDPKFAPALVVEAGFNAEMPGLFGGVGRGRRKII
ncbi:MAG: hypothetical protein M5R36_23305 [Deltaproteobacteria bacterium]|nr:hypothetical protein [Deltaproteobacteria bacterium]